MYELNGIEEKIMFDTFITVLSKLRLLFDKQAKHTREDCGSSIATTMLISPAEMLVHLKTLIPSSKGMD